MAETTTPATTSGATQGPGGTTSSTNTGSTRTNTMSTSTENSHQKAKEDSLHWIAETRRMPTDSPHIKGVNKPPGWSEHAQETLASEGIHWVQKVLSVAIMIMRQAGRTRMLSDDIEAAMDSLGVHRPYGLTRLHRMPTWRRVQTSNMIRNPVTPSKETRHVQAPPMRSNKSTKQNVENVAWYLQSHMIKVEGGRSQQENEEETVRANAHEFHHAFGQKYPYETSTLSMHWLAVNGVQPLIPENPTEEQTLAYAARQFDSFKRSDPKYKKLYDSLSNTTVFESKASLSPFATAAAFHTHDPSSHSASEYANQQKTSQTEQTRDSGGPMAFAQGEEWSRIFSDCEQFAQRLSISKEQSFFLRSIWNIVNDDNAIVAGSELQRSADMCVKEIGNCAIKDISKLSSCVSKLLNTSLKERKGENQPLLVTLGSDQQLPSGAKYLVQMVEDLVYKEDRSVVKLLNAMCLTFQLLQNPYFEAETYLSQLIPAIATCVFGDSLGKRAGDSNHWMVRDLAARNYSEVFKKYGDSVPSLSARLELLVEKVITDCCKDIPSPDELDAGIDKGEPNKKKLRYRPLFGAVYAAELMGPHAIQTTVLPNVESLVQKLRHHAGKMDTCASADPSAKSLYKVWRIECRAVLVALHRCVKKAPSRLKGNMETIWRRLDH